MASTVQEWTSEALSRLGLAPPEVAERVVRLTGVPDTPTAREIVELDLCALDVSLEVGLPELLAPQLSWEVHRWAQVSAEEVTSRPWGAVRFVLGEHLDELTLLSVLRHVEMADDLAATLVGHDLGNGVRGGLAGLPREVQEYLGHAVSGEDLAAVDHVLRLADSGWSVPELLLGLIVPAQEELGRLWERGALSVAQEHMATAITHLAMYSLHPRLYEAPRLGCTLVAATVPEDRHSVGLRVVSDLLQRRGWEVHYVGLSCPMADVIDAVVDSGASLLLLGCSMTCHLPSLRRAVDEVRADPRCDGVRVVVGGRPFNQVPELGTWVGSDLAAGHAIEVLEATDDLLALAPSSRAGSIS